ncbi:TonB-dependent receptor [Bermanella marisrubri]|uniref:TonB-dependent receptor n=1 Tax=Bermanella marisrubri TaxID=207949 RepID=Q1N1I1_9GAMM|nr:TonB-dependent receptor [Bermanella marisrubri]EAT12069.1 TonB-dependent receptor [Oceanobacter sp. RED65] [Bermanella marisrubri]QIZ83536.1 TonB-dependent receptor [Bermanella marisrubri]
MKRNLLAGFIAAISASGALAGEAVFYVTEQGQPVDTLSITVNGDRKLVGKNGFASFELGGGTHQVELSEFGQWAGEFEFDASAQQNAEIQVEMIGGEAVPEISVYTPGQEEAPVYGQISGYIESDETGGGVEGATITVAGAGVSVQTDGEGYYELELPRGEYNLSIEHPTYGARDISDLRVIGNYATAMNVNMSMSGDSAIEEVVAVGSYIPSTATAQQRDSSAVLNAIGSEQLARFGDSNAASALKRVAGVSLVGGQYAVVRGLQGRYISSTLNGASMPSTNPMKRDVPLDLFPSSVLKGIEIQKSYTPDLPGDTTGGAIRMTTKGLPAGYTNKLSLSVGANSQITGKDVISYDGGDTDSLGFDDGTREVPSSVASITNDGAPGALGDRCEIGCEFSFDDVSSYIGEFENNYNSKQVTAKPNVGFAYSYGDLIESTSGDFGYYGAIQYSSKWSSRENAYIDDMGGQFDYERSKYNIDLTAYLAAGMETFDGTLLNSKTILLRKSDDTTRFETGVDDEGITVDELTLQWVERQLISQQFSGSHTIGDGDQLDWRIGLSQSNRYEPDRRTYQYRNKTLAPATLERRFSELTENAIDMGADMQHEFYFNDMVSMTLKYGAMLSIKDREVDLSRYGVDKNNNVSVPNNSDLEVLLSEDNLDQNAYFLATRTTDTDSYDAQDEMFATYVSSEFDINGEYKILAGARLEDSNQELTYPNSNNADSELSATEVLPVLSGTWVANEQLQFRLGVSNTLARPGLTELSESSTYDPETDDELFGNPDLEISNITNLDLRTEYYFSEDENISVAVFSKSIDKPIEKSVPNASGSSADGFTYVNSDSADVFGVELDFRKNIFNGEDWTGFLSGNFAWVDSEVELNAQSKQLEGRDTRQLQGQSEIIGNLQLGFDQFSNAQSITLLVNYFDDRIDKVTRNVDLEMEKGRTVIDLVHSWDVSDTMTLKTKFNNITDSKVEYSQGGRIIESYEEGIEASVGIDWIF